MDSKKKKNLLALGIIVVLALLSTALPRLLVDPPEMTYTGPFAEPHHQVDLTKISLTPTEDGDLLVSPAPGLSPEEDKALTGDVALLEELLDKCAPLKEQLAAYQEAGETTLLALSWTEAPMRQVRGQLLRLPAGSQEETAATFLLCTLLTADEGDPNELMAYCRTLSIGMWEGPRPFLTDLLFDGQADQIHLTTSPHLGNVGCRLEAQYRDITGGDPIAGEDGWDYWHPNGSAHWVQFNIEDSPDVRSCTHYLLSCRHQIWSDTEPITVESSYIHMRKGLQQGQPELWTVADRLSLEP